ncbi:MAG: hypothetical protein M0Z50_15690 [Planctomycetia bacterium]|nr:hypothetical protein [Planctomycetia bacterium]
MRNPLANVLDSISNAVTAMAIGGGALVAVIAYLIRLPWEQRTQKLQLQRIEKLLHAICKGMKQAGIALPEIEDDIHEPM